MVTYLMVCAGSIPAGALGLIHPAHQERTVKEVVQVSMTVGHNLDRYEGHKLMFARQAAFKAARFPVEMDDLLEDLAVAAPLYSDLVTDLGTAHA